MESELKYCSIHGNTEFHYYEKKNRKGLWKCLKCESETAIFKKLKYKLKAVNYKGGKCEKCGYDKNISALEFHHINPDEKDFGISETHHSWNSIVKELDKCILVCANCHREIHNPQSTFENLYRIAEKHEVKKKIKAQSKQINFKYTLDDLLSKRDECTNWKEVADYYGVSLSTIKRHKSLLEKN